MHDQLREPLEPVLVSFLLFRDLQIEDDVVVRVSAEHCERPGRIAYRASPRVE
jgi:hypothetical protein